MQNRDFKGVWIPKEIWLNKELTLLEKAIFVEIDSLDNENHCTAGNEYFAEFCGCSESKVTKAIKKLQDLNMIEVISFNGRIRTLRVVKNDIQSSKKYEAESQKVRPINIYNNTSNNTVLSKDNTAPESEFVFGKDANIGKPKKKTNDVEFADAKLLVRNYTNNCSLIQQLTILVNTKYEICKTERRHFYATTIKNYLDELTRTFGSNEEQKIEAVKLSIRYNGTTKVMKPNVQNNNGKRFDDLIRPHEEYDMANHTLSEREF